MRLITELQEAIRFVRLSRIAFREWPLWRNGKGKGYFFSVTAAAGRSWNGIPTLQREEDEVTPRDDLERGDTPSCNLSCVIEDNFGESKRNEGENLPTTCFNCLR